MSSKEDLIRVGVDARCLNRPHLRGIGKYLWEIIDRSSATQGIHWEIFADRPDLPLHHPTNADLTAHVFDCRGYRFHVWEQLALPNRARRCRVDVLHCTASSLPLWQPLPVVLTLHDTIPWQQDEPGWSSGWYRDWLLPRAFKKCAAVIAASEAAKRDILCLWPNLADKIHVIPHGIADHYLQATLDPISESLTRAGVRTPYLLYVGGEIPRKRLDWAIRILGELTDTRLNLVICGVERGTQDLIRNTVNPELRSRLCFLPFTEEAEMPSLYANAVAVLYPTLYEGFGLPALEAQAVGTPVLFSSVGSLAELEGPCAVVLPTHDLKAWVKTCRQCLADRFPHRNSNEVSRRWARKFSWDVSVVRHLDVYRRVLKVKKRRTQTELSLKTSI